MNSDFVFFFLQKQYIVCETSEISDVINVNRRIDIHPKKERIDIHPKKDYLFRTQKNLFKIYRLMKFHDEFKT